MKTMMLLFATAILVMLGSCNNYPQSIGVRTTYNTPAADSCYMLVWKGNDPNQNPLFEDGDYHSLVLPSPDITVYKIPTGTNQQFTVQMIANGLTFKIALVPFDNNIPAPLTVSAFYVLPIPPGKAEIINVEMF